MVFDQAIAGSPKHVPLLQRKAQRLAGQGEWEMARDAIIAIPQGERGFDDSMMLMHCRLRLKHAAAAPAAIPELTALARLPEHVEFAADVPSRCADTCGLNSP